MGAIGLRCKTLVSGLTAMTTISEGVSNAGRPAPRRPPGRARKACRGGGSAVGGAAALRILSRPPPPKKKLSLSP